jgi:hypothetical protein
LDSLRSLQIEGFVMGRRSAGAAVEPVRELSEFDRLIAERLRSRGVGEPEPDPLAPGHRDTAPQSVDFSSRPRRRRKPRGTALDWVSLVLAVVVPPLGLLVNIVSRIVNFRRHGWTTTVAKVATVLSIVFTLVLGAGVFAYSVVAERGAAAAKVIADAQPLCSAIAETPGVLDIPAYGWPTEVATIPVTLEAMKAYQLRWQQLADVAPDSATANLQAIADQAQTLVVSVETSQAIDRNGNLATMAAVTGASGLPGWVDRHCS